MQLCFFEGKICKTDPELKMTQSGKQLCNFSIQIKEGFGSSTQYVYINCIAWGKQADFVAKYFQKKSLIQVRGKFKNNNYQRKDGSTVSSLQFNVQEIFFPPKNTGNAEDEYEPDESDSTYSNAQTDDGFSLIEDAEDLPF